MRLIWQLIAVAAVAFLGSQGVAAVTGDPWPTLALGLLTAVVAVVVYRWVVRRTEHRPPRCRLASRPTSWVATTRSRPWRCPSRC